jgi:hypothetical protein
VVAVIAAGGVIAAPKRTASPTALAQTATPVIQRLAQGLIVITFRVLL